MSEAVMKNYIITRTELNAFVANLIANGSDVVMPTPDNLGFRPITDANAFQLHPALRPTNVSPKEYFFPRTEPVVFFHRSKDDVEIIDPPVKAKPRIIFGAKPCDAKAVEIMDKVMNWDYHDSFFNERKEKTIVIGLSCTYADASCFCTSVGLSPDSTDGSDLFLKQIDEESFEVKVITEKGATLLAQHAGSLVKNDATTASAATSSPSTLERSFDSVSLKQWLDANFDHPAWETVAESCIGCAQCAFVCPTCHCFDLVDEEIDYTSGRRMKNWDACQFGHFTVHASGHNPRDARAKRYRQRMSHKFKYYHDRFGEILCTGCGRCIRGCPVGVDIGEIAAKLASIHE